MNFYCRILGGPSIVTPPRPYNPTPDLIAARTDVAKLNALKVSANDYADAAGIHGGIFEHLEGEAVIGEQDNLEDDASKHLFKIAAANEGKEISRAQLAEANALAIKLTKRLKQDSCAASAGDSGESGDELWDGQLAQIAFDRASPDEDQNLQLALSAGNTPDVIPLSGTQAFIKQFSALTARIVDDAENHGSAATPGSSAATIAKLQGDKAVFVNMVNTFRTQVCLGGRDKLGIAQAKIAALPEGDPQRAAYVKQVNDLQNDLDPLIILDDSKLAFLGGSW